MTICNENDCLQEFYNIGGICYKCNETSPHCSKCSYNSVNGSKEKIFKCLGCDDPDLKVLNKKDGQCHRCNVSNCKKCGFDINDNDICEECITDYFVNNIKTCSQCYWVEITGGRYYYCRDKTSERKKVECSSYYAKNDTYNCLRCPAGCISCTYNSQTKTFHCPSCYSSYYLLNGNCNSCPAHCSSCNLNQNNIPVCTECSGGYYIVGNNCESCDPHWRILYCGK